MSAYHFQGFLADQVEAISDIMFRGYSSKLRISEREVCMSVVTLTSGQSSMQFELVEIDTSNAKADGEGTVYKYSGTEGEGGLEIVWDEPIKTAVERFNEIMAIAIAQANRK